VLGIRATSLNKHGFSHIFSSVPKGRVPEDGFYRPHANGAMNGNPFDVGSQAREPDVFATYHRA